ncbi:MAG TPA: integrin alpha, partial [Flavobacteriales bacterium]|nr:integrin alpha [Flavobacteriales bacterium]
MACRPLVTEGQAWAVSILLDRIGRGDDWSEPNPDAATERIKEYMVSRHGAFDLEHVNNEAGIRQNFIVHRKLEGEGPLRVELRTEGDLVCTHAGADIFHFTDTAGIIRLRYADLHVWDANGDTLPAAATLEDDRIVLLVEDELAAYPITVDPLLTTAVWTMDGDQSNGEFGWSVSTAGDVNGDGYSDIIIGHHLFDNGQTNEGRVVVYHGSASGPA